MQLFAGTISGFGDVIILKYLNIFFIFFLIEEVHMDP